MDGHDMVPARVASLVLATFLLSGCFGGVFQVEASSPLVLAAFAYDGSSGRELDGTLKATLYDGRNAGTIVAQYQDAVDSFEIRITNFTGNAAWQSGGVATDLPLFGPSGNGPPVLPQLRAYAAAWGPAEYFVDGVLQPDPTNLQRTWNATFFVSQGAYRDNETRRVTTPGGGTFDPSQPQTAPASQIGATAVIMLETSRGDLYRLVEYSSVRIITR
jgi:hypothetical protein